MGETAQRVVLPNLEAFDRAARLSGITEEQIAWQIRQAIDSVKLLTTAVLGKVWGDTPLAQISSPPGRCLLQASSACRNEEFA
jgi:hypothetical protein